MDALYFYRHTPIDSRNCVPEHAIGVPTPLPPDQDHQQLPTEPKLVDYLEPCSEHFIPWVVVTTHGQLEAEQANLGRCNVSVLLARSHEVHDMKLTPANPAIAYDSGVIIGRGKIAQCVRWLVERQERAEPESQSSNIVSDYSLRPEPIIHISLN